jgi:hypothetical protein
MPTRATGPFDVKLTPQPLVHATTADPPMLARMSLEKTYHGDLEATAHAEMLTAAGSVKGSAAYSAIERVTGSLHGRSGSFALQHTGIMTRGTPQLSITVVPDSGTGELAGLTGKLNIINEAGKHSYDFEYTLDDAR